MFWSLIEIAILGSMKFGGSLCGKGRSNTGDNPWEWIEGRHARTGSKLRREEGWTQAGNTSWGGGLRH